jgi:hypothetical protein
LEDAGVSPEEVGVNFLTGRKPEVHFS